MTQDKMTKQQGEGMPDEIYAKRYGEANGGTYWNKPREGETGTRYIRADLATPAAEIEEDIKLTRALKSVEGAPGSISWGMIDMLVKGRSGYIIEIIKAARAYASQSRADQWQPIETAPRDGTHILVFPALMGVPLVSSWEEKSKEFKFVGFWRNPMTEQPVPYKPTHWQPIPAPPKGAADAN